MVGRCSASGTRHERLSQRKLQIFRKLALGTALTAISGGRGEYRRRVQKLPRPTFEQRAHRKHAIG
jgi:hypothetical protein